MFPQNEKPTVGRWYQVTLTSGRGLNEAANDLARALWTAGHEVYQTSNDEGDEIIAALVRAPWPDQEMRRLMERAKLTGYFEVLPWTGRT